MHYAGTLRRSMSRRCELTIPAAVLLAGLLACGPAGQRDTRAGRALLIGIDGVSPGLVAELIEAGELPQLAALAERGASGTARSLQPILSPRIWTTMVTGKLPEVHGIEHFAHTSPRGEPRLYTSLDRKVPALWNIASAAGLRVGVVNWLMTQPPERIDGVMISDHAAPGAARGRLNLAAGVVGIAPRKIQNSGAGRAFTHPEAWAPRFAKLRYAKAPLTEIPNPFEGKTGPLWERLQLSHTRDTMVVRAALEIEAELDPHLLLVYMNGTDAVSHLFWAALAATDATPPAFRISDEVRKLQRTALLGYYRSADALVGRLVERYGPDDLVLVVSDHGFEIARPGDLTAGVHFTERAIDGIVFAAGRGVAAGSRVTNMGVADVAPSLLAWLGLPVGDDMVGRVASFIDAAPERVASHDGLSIEHVGGEVSAADAAILDQLRALGYIDE